MSDVEKAVETTESPVDRKELLAQQFEEAENAAQEPKSESGRNEKGQFTKAKPEAEAPQEDTAEMPVWKRPPASWKKDYHELWNSADDKLKEYAYQREEQMRRGVESVLTKAQFADQINEVINPYVDTIRGLGLEPAQAISALMQADHILRTGSADQKAQYFQQLAQQYGIQLGETAPQTTQAPQYSSLVNELNNLRGQFMGMKQAQESAQNQQLMTEIDAFAQKAEHFEDARPTMIQLLQSGLATDLQDAYDKAVRFDPALFEQVQQAQQAKAAAEKSAQLNRAAKAARAAAVSVRSSTPGTNTAPKAQDRRSLLAEQFDSMTERL
jgi:hypothetical protein